MGFSSEPGHTRRGDATTRRAGSWGSPPASPPIPPGPERRQVEVAPGGAHSLVAAVVDEIGAEDPFAIAEECVVPCHSPTPKSASNSSVSVYQGIAQPIRAFHRLMSGCGARETNASVVSRASDE